LNIKQLTFQAQAALTSSCGFCNKQRLFPYAALDKCIPFDIFPTRCTVTQLIYFSKTALHVSGGIFTHHQEYTQLFLQYLVLVKPLLLLAAIVDELEPV
jgi:hypothetical protein